MINPNRAYGPATGTIVDDGRSKVYGEFKVQTDNGTYMGYDLPDRFKVGDTVTFQVQFSIMSDRFRVLPETVRRRNAASKAA